MATLITIILTTIIVRLFWRPIVTLATWCALIGALMLLWRAAGALGLSGAWLSSAYGAGLVGFFVGLLVALKPIINFLIESDYTRAVDKARQDADRRRV